MPPPGELAQARKAASLTLTDRLDIHRAVTTSDGSGGRTQTWPVLHAGVHCNIGQPTTSEVFRSGRLAGEADYAGSVPVGTDIKATDKVTWRGHRLEVTGVSDQTDDVLTRVYLKRT